MKIYNIKDMINGWFIGNFKPSIYKTDKFEIAHHLYKKGFGGTNHKHLKSTEINYIVKGHISWNNVDLYSGDIFVFDFGEESGDILFLEDTDLIIVKFPSVPSDKVIV
jgi:mannose-6-phosphate isomerase-like protein (cupin superfamily)